MAITRRYETEEECTHLFVNENYDNIPSSWFHNNPNVDIWFMGLRDGEDGYDEDDEDFGTFGYTHEPMWSIWFRPNNSWEEDWIRENEKQIAELGFTIVHMEYEWGGEIFLGVDGAGYSFYDAHWIPLYRLHGFEWHKDK